MNRFTISLTVALAWVCLRATPAAAQHAELDVGGSQERPWANGVPQDKQAAAAVPFHEGNQLLKNSLFPRAVEKYREALKHWDHPAIHYNMALALLNLNEPLALHHHLTESMRYGEAPLDKDKFERAANFKTLIEGQLSHVDITCDVEGTTVMLDGQELFKAPGRYQGFVKPGPHTISAIKAGYLRQDRKRNLTPGEKLQLPLKLYADEELTRYNRYWAAWKPWTMLGVGAAVAAGGGLLHLQARDSFASFDTGVQSCGGCIPERALDSKRTRGDTLQKVAVGTYAAGGGALVTGLVLLYVNRARPYQVSPDELEQGASVAAELPAVSVVPLVGGDKSGVLAVIRF